MCESPWPPHLFAAQVQHVNRYPPNVAPKPGRLADGLTEVAGSGARAERDIQGPLRERGGEQECCNQIVL